MASGETQVSLENRVKLLEGLLATRPAFARTGHRSPSAEPTDQVFHREDWIVQTLQSLLLDFAALKAKVERAEKEENDERPTQTKQHQKDGKWTATVEKPNLTEFQKILRERGRDVKKSTCKFVYQPKSMIGAEEEWLLHFVSADMKRGAGIAKDLANEFGPVQVGKYKIGDVVAQKLGERTLLNLAMKERFFHKIYYEPESYLANYKLSLEKARKFCSDNNVSRLGICRLGAGMEKVPWRYTERLIRRVFDGLNIEIHVYLRPSEERRRPLQATLGDCVEEAWQTARSKRHNTPQQQRPAHNTKHRGGREGRKDARARNGTRYVENNFTCPDKSKFPSLAAPRMTIAEVEVDVHHPAAQNDQDPKRLRTSPKCADATVAPSGGSARATMRACAATGEKTSPLTLVTTPTAALSGEKHSLLQSTDNPDETLVNQGQQRFNLRDFQKRLAGLQGEPRTTTAVQTEAKGAENLRESFAGGGGPHQLPPLESDLQPPRQNPAHGVCTGGLEIVSDCTTPHSEISESLTLQDVMKEVRVMRQSLDSIAEMRKSVDALLDNQTKFQVPQDSPANVTKRRTSKNKSSVEKKKWV
jgi:hypothetical protein